MNRRRDYSSITFRASKLEAERRKSHVRVYCPVCSAGFKSDEAYKTHYHQEHSKKKK